MRNKTLKRIIIVFAIIVLIVAILFGVFFILTQPRAATDPDVITEPIIWQKQLKDEVLLRDVVMPGSHDAGTAGMNNLMETQSHRLDVQLKFGVRYFDVRPMEYGGELYPYHLLANTKYPFKELLAETVAFLTKNSTEFAILDFQHFERAEELTKEMLDSIPDIQKMAVPNTVAFDTLTVGEMRANKYQLVIIWNEGYSAANRDYLFRRGAVLDSPYHENAHKGGNDALIAQLDNYYQNATQNKLFVLQAQRTGSFGSEMNIAKLEDEFRPVVNEYLKNLNDEQLQKTNIVMRDYVTRDAETMRLIIGLNQRKQNFAVSA